MELERRTPTRTAAISVLKKGSDPPWMSVSNGEFHDLKWADRIAAFSVLKKGSVPLWLASDGEVHSLKEHVHSLIGPDRFFNSLLVLIPMSRSAHDLVTPRGTSTQMLAAVKVLDPLGAARALRVLSQNEIDGLEENARRVALKYWATKGQRTAASLQNQLNRGRWHYIQQAPYAMVVLTEIEADSGMNLQFYP
ncbi:MAG: hypothetical protein EXS05_00450 [Planctomycetaceae bacterium]|nr:hypothetical protein [Planctomycetaceae bacterium]